MKNHRRYYHFFMNQNAVKALTIVALVVTNIYIGLFIKNSDFSGEQIPLLISLNSTTTEQRSSTTEPQKPVIKKQRHKSSSSSSYRFNYPLTAREIINQAYSESYGILETFCSNKDEELKTCLRRLRESGGNSTSILNNTTSPSWPWWFHTLLRDTGGYEKVPSHYKRRTTPIHGPWHYLDIGPPFNIKMCSIEKIATTQFRRLQCEINTGTNKHTGVKPCHPPTRLKAAEASKIVFLRDPLERYLSGFMAKCIHSRARQNEGHCEPNDIFRNNGVKIIETKQVDKGKTTTKTTKQKSENVDYMGLLLREKHVFFQAFVHSSPLQWNTHFMPQALYCDGLFRHIKDYDFVGTMDKTFHQDLFKFGQQFGHGLPAAIKKIFHVDLYLKIEGNETEQVRLNKGTETAAASHVYEYFSPDTVRKLLQYMSIDYVLFDLPIPHWVDDILQQEYNDIVDVIED